jgi:hypothetical protein
MTSFAFAGRDANGPVTGAAVTVNNLDLARNTAAMEVVNNSRKHIAAYSVVIVSVYANGIANRSEKMEDYGPLFTSRGDDLYPGGVIELTDTFGISDENPPVRVDAKMGAIVYADRTAEVSDEEACGRIQSHRSSTALALSKSVEILQRYLADPRSDHPGVAASAEIEIKRLSKLAEQAARTDRVYLQGVSEKLDEALQAAARSNAGERNSASQYLTELQQRAEEETKYAEITRAQ